MTLVRRTCTLVGERDGEEQPEGRGQSLAELREEPAYVLLGDPGAGKTTAFEQEARQPGCLYVTARNLLSLEMAKRPEWRDTVLYVDGLDEVRAGSADARTPFDAIRGKLDALRPPGFRLSCRAADWLGPGDRSDLEEVAPGGKVLVLHLDPLTDDDVLAILSEDARVQDARVFIERAERRGLGGLLPNPKTLDLLVEAVAEDHWPSTRQETFELACSKLVREHNREHLAARHTERPTEDLLQEAGALCAVLLLSGSAGYTLSIDASGDDLVRLADVSLDAIRASGDGLRSKLFVWPQEAAEPVHRTVAEYLGARYLADRVENAGLPVGRLLALMTGSDGGIVSDLRGLAAWVATVSASARAEIIERDPVAVTLYGDLGELNNAAHEQLLSALRREMERYPYIPSRGRRPRSSLAGLSTAQLEPTLQGILESTDRGETQQALAKLVGEIVTEGEPRPRLRECLLRAVRDSSWWPIVRFRALEAVIQIGSVAPDTSDQLEALMAEIQRGELSDPDDALENRLLATLYPDRIPTTKLLDYLHAPRRPHNLGPFYGFWLSTLFKRASANDLATLLDGLAEGRPALRETVDESLLLRRFTGTLLARTLMTHKGPIEAPRLFAWLGVGLDRYDRIEGVDRDQRESIRAWLAAHPDAYKAVFAYGLTHLPDGEWAKGEVRRLLSNRLYGATPPADFAASCLELAADTENETLARVLFRVAVEAITDENTQTALSREGLDAWVAEHAFAESWLREALAPPPWREKKERQERERQAKATEKQRERQRAVREHEHELREGRASLGLLEYLAATYFDLFAEVKGDTPRQRLVWLLGDDPGLVESAVIGLQRSIDREDIPDVQEVLRLDAENKRHRMSLPFLAGLEETTPDELERLTDHQWRLAVALQLTQESVLQHGLGKEPSWLEQLRAAKPSLVSDVLVDFARIQLKTGKAHAARLWELARDDRHAGVARLAALRLLRVFPVRSKADVLGNLKYLLQAAMRYADAEELLALIGTKLTRRGMDVAQRAYWLGAGLLLEPEAYVDQVEAYAGVTEVRVRHLAAFLALDTFEHARDRRGWPPLHELTTEALRLLIRLIGESYGPMALEGGAHWSGPADDAADLVQVLINTVGERTGTDATIALEDLVAEPALARWRHHLRGAAHRQRALARDASFGRASVAEVVRTLRNEQPANVADLAALTLDVLRDLAKEIRHSATDDYLQFWNETPMREPTEPKHEDACRDALLSKLRSRLSRLNVGAQPEGHYADDKRADIRVSSSGFNVPIEIKKNSHRDLWHAIHTQLIAKYARDPGADGFGIYVVLWFGAKLTANPREGGKPRSPAELEQRLESTLSTEDARRISVCVIDASAPAREASTNR